ncbi:MAG: hypothetical protein EPO21_21735 [Chloroflexota bacterium]|nr:MAG: hypothetical protein EPO21_21735 [Chloroflexota bacterium]
MTYENILVERDGNVAILKINRPKVLNAFNDATVLELTAAFDEFAADANVRAVVVTGAGDRAFIAGADINELRALKNSMDGLRKVSLGHQLLKKIESLPKPVIMAINGFALGGGTEFALAGDIRIAADTARLGLPEINLGIFPGMGGTQRLPRLVGKSIAKRMMFTGDHITADEALRIGMVDQVVPAAELMDTALTLARTIASKAPIAMALTKKAINEGMETDLDRGVEIESAYWGIAATTEDRVEGTSAFLEKRKAEWKGR